MFKVTVIVITILIIALLIGSGVLIYFFWDSNSTGTCNVELVSRNEWNAQPAKLVEPMPNPVPFVIIHHSYMPEACNTEKECIEAMQWMQDLHQNKNGWNDIGYSFAVGGDNRAYIGRGWSSVGAHAPKYNNQSIGICIIGDWTNQVPPEEQLETVKNLIKCGVNQGHINPNYTLLGHRQVRDTECPGDALYAEIKKWPHYSPDPLQPYVPTDDNTVPT